MNGHYIFLDQFYFNDYETKNNKNSLPQFTVISFPGSDEIYLMFNHFKDRVKRPTHCCSA